MIEANVGSIIMLSSVIKPHFVKICLFLVVILLGFNVSVVFLGWPRSKVTGIDSNRQRELGIRDMDSQLHGRFEYDEAFYYDLSEEEDSAELAIFTTTLSETPEPSTTTHENKRWTFSLSTTVMPTTASVPSIATTSRKPPTRVPPHAPARAPPRAPPRATASKPKPNPSHKSNPYMRTCTCREKMCYDCLQSEDKRFYKYCLRNTKRMFFNTSLTDQALQGSCRFMDGKRRAAVGLVSFMGSGNTWVRGLLEIATGYCTGAIYCDEILRRSGMNGESVRSGAVLVTKTHFSNNITWTAPDRPRTIYLPKIRKNKFHPAYGSAILLIRNPYNALVAEYTRFLYTYIYKKNRTKSHTEIMTQESKFGNNSNWNRFIHIYTPQWKEYFSNWLVAGTSRGHPVLVVRYEDLKLDPPSEIMRMLDFLHISYTEEKLRQTLQKQTYEIFQRSHSINDTFDHYTSTQRELINNTISDTIRFLQTNYSSTLGLEDYLWSS